MLKPPKQFYGIFRPRRRAMLLWLIAVIAAVAGALTKRIAVLDDRGVKCDLYVIGKKESPKVAVITNKKPADAVKECIKRCF